MGGPDLGASFQAGLISYREGAADGGEARETGREWFEMVRHAGGRTLRAFCEMDDLALSRDVTMALDALSRPLDAFVRVIRGGTVIGSTLFVVRDGALRCQGRIEGLGDVDQTLRLTAPLRYLGLHPLVGDALIALARGTGRPGVFEPIACYSNSQAPAGDEGLIAMPVTIDVAYLGGETIDVAAGRYDARAYALRWKPEWAPARLWVHGPDALFLKLEWPEFGVEYELVRHRVGR